MRLHPYLLWVVTVSSVLPPGAALAQFGGPAQKPAQPSASSPSDQQTLEKLSRARVLQKQMNAERDDAKRGPIQSEFEETLRSIATTFTKVAVGSEGQPAKFQKLTLNAQSRGFDTIRFETPAAAKPLDLDWEFVLPGKGADAGMSGWYIVARVGDVQGFANYHFERNDKIEGLDLPAENLHVTQSLSGGKLKPASEYLIWFVFDEEKTPVPAWIKIDVKPAVDEEPTHEEPALSDEEASGHELRRFTLKEPAVGVVISPDGRRVLIANGQDIVVEDITTGREIKRLATGHDVWCLALSPTGRKLVTGSGDHTLRLWNLDTGKQAGGLKGHDGTVNCVAFSPDGRQVLSGSEDRTLRLWDATTGKELRRFEGHEDQIFGVAFSPDGRRCVSGASGGDPVARVWDTTTGQVVLRLEGNSEALYGVAFSKDGRGILTGGADDTLRLWDAAAGKEIRRFETKGGNVNSVAFLPDSRHAVSAGEDKVVYLWDTASKPLLRSFKGHTSWIGLRCLAVSPDGRYAVTCADDRTVLIWDLGLKTVSAKATKKPKSPR